MTYKVTINGKSYEVSVERTDAPAAAPVAAATPVAAKPAAQPIPAGAETVKAPMPGSINAVNVQAGDTVKKGQTLLILEAMKMENEIVAPHDATVANIAVSKGSSVSAGDVLLTLK